MSGFPRKFGDYLLLGSIGHGGMGEIFLAKVAGPAGIERLCVVKVVRADVDDQTYVGRFIDEARIMCQLSHGNICHLNDVGVTDGQFYLSMEHIFGVTLKELVGDADRDADFMPIAVHIIGEVLKGLDYAHRNKNPITGAPVPVVHRDISPQNVMVNFEGEVKLIDFGLAASDQKIEQTDQNTVMGKIAYMSPEQARGAEVDGRSDEFTAAILAYELIAGERFYDPALPPHTIWGLSGSGGVFPKRFEELNKPIRDVLRKALAPRPEDRYPTCGAFREALLDAAPEGVRGAQTRLRNFMEEKYGQSMRAKLEPLAALADLPFYEGPLAMLMTPLEHDAGTEASMPAPPADMTEASSPIAEETEISSPAPELRLPAPTDQDTSVTGSHELLPPPNRAPRALAAGLGLILIVGLAILLWPSDDLQPPELGATDAVATEPPVLEPPPPTPVEPEVVPVAEPEVVASPKRQLRLRSTPRGAKAALVGVAGAECKTPCELQVDQGLKVAVIFSRIGYRSVRRTAVVGEGGASLSAKLSRDSRALRKAVKPIETKASKLKNGKIKGKNAVADPWAR